MLTYPSAFFSGDYNSAFRVCCPVKFLHALQPSKLYFQLDLERRAPQVFALPHISSCFRFFSEYFYILVTRGNKSQSAFCAIVML